VSQPNPKMHLLAVLAFLALAVTTAWVARSSADARWQVFSALAFVASGLALLLFARARRREALQQRDQYAAYPEGQARLIDSGRLPNRFNPRFELKDYELCHFFIEAQRLFFLPLPDTMRIDPTRLLIRFSGGNYYYIVRPQEILLPAELDDQVSGELVITNQRILFLAQENGFEVPLHSLKMLDCSAHLVDFQVRGRRYTIRTEAAGYAEKVLALLIKDQ
jgi:hypothetical protein